MHPQFSVIIPTRDREHFLHEAVASVLVQRDVTLELLVVNDGGALQASFADRHVRVLDNGRRTAVPARNLGVEQAHGAFIAFLDDDDVWIDDQHLAKAAARFAAGDDFYFADGEMVFPDGSKKYFRRDATAQSLAADNTILVSAIAYRRSLHEVLGRFDEANPYYWDWDWYLRVARGGFRLFHQTDLAVCIRVHGQNMSSLNEAARRQGLDALVAKHGLGPIPIKNHTDFV